MTRNNLIAYIIIGAAIAIGLIIGLRGCERKPGPDHAVDKAVIDSITNKAHKDSAVAAKITAVLTDSLSKLRHANDSLEIDQKWQEGMVLDKATRLKWLIRKIDSLKAKNDTLGQLAGCDSLRDLYEGAAKIVGGYEYLSDSLIDRLKSERKLSDSVKNYLYSMFSQSNNDLFEISRKYNNLYEDYKKVNVRPKRWSLGPSAGAFITNNGVGYGIGITLSYSILKF